MTRPEKVQKGLVGALIGIVLNPHDLSVAGISSTNIRVSGIVKSPLRISNLGVGDAMDSLKGKLHPPKAPGRELCKMVTRCRQIRIGAKGFHPR